MKRIWWLLLVIAVAWVAALVGWGQPLGWDEIEFFRASRWMGEGRVPFRDFWEHHTPLQWIVFAPVARLFGGGPGAASVVAMRWAQLLVWAGVFALLLAAGRRASVPIAARLAGLVLLAASPSFVNAALEFRVDVLGNLLYLAGVLLMLGLLTRTRAVALGAILAAAVLSNMRLAPLVVVTAVTASLVRPDERRWGWRREAPWMGIGVVTVAAVFVGWLWGSGALPAFVGGVVRYNVASARLLEVDTFFVTLLLPLWARDVAGLAFGALAAAGTLLAMREIRRPGPLQVLAVLLGASLATVAAMEVQYPYHFQNVLLLAAPLAGAAAALPGPWEKLAACVAAVALGINLLGLLSPTFGNELHYQDAVMRTADRVTRPGETVWDGCGYALRREPAYRYWFLPTGLRFLAGRGAVKPFDPAAAPPAAIVYNLRLQRWFEIFPGTARHVVRHYVPLYRNLWVPGLSAAVAAGGRAAWVVPREGEYRVWASPALLRHPWLTDPLGYAAVTGPRAARYAIPLEQLPLIPDSLLRWRVDGRAVSGGRGLRLRKGARVEVVSTAPAEVGVLVVPAEVRRLAISTPEVFEF